MQSKNRLKTPPRGKLEIRADILHAIRAGPCGREIITRIQRKAGLWGNYKRLDFEISELMGRGFVEGAPGSGTRNILDHVDGPQRIGSEHPVYSLTDRGRIWLESYDLLVDEAFGSAQCDTIAQSAELGQK
jgi:predicted transcriptional regulator